MAGSLANGRPKISVVSGVQTMPMYEEYTAVTFAVVANRVRLQVTGCTETQLRSLVDKYLLADDGAETSEVRLVNEVQVVDGTPDTYFVIISEPFTVAAASYDLLYVDPINSQLTNTVLAGVEAVYVDGVEAIAAGQEVTFNPAEPYRPLVLYSDYPYKLSNGTFFFDGGVGSAAPEIIFEEILLSQAAAITPTTFFTPDVDGYYQIGWNAEINVAATSSSTLGHFQVRYTSPTDSVSKSTPVQNNVTASAGNSTSTCVSGTFTIYAKAGTAIEYVMGYATSGATAMRYSLKIIAIKL